VKDGRNCSYCDLKKSGASRMRSKLRERWYGVASSVSPLIAPGSGRPLTGNPEETGRLEARTRGGRVDDQSAKVSA
jgi:hypothetical protein